MIFKRINYDSGYYTGLQVVEEEKKQESRCVPLENLKIHYNWKTLFTALEGIELET